MNEISSKVGKIKKMIKEADAILIGAGSGLSTSAGVKYSGEEFAQEFMPFINKYNFMDLYTASFYDFPSEEEKWGFFAKFIKFADTGRNALPLYKKLYNLVKDKEYFVLTTNVDDQFLRAGFDKNKYFATQGSYSKLQCSVPCHNKLYDNTELVEKMIKNTDNNLKIPKELVPKCPICGKPMEVNLRKDGNFVQDDEWYKQDNSYGEFLDNNADKKVLLLELGVGFNTPGIIRFPFEQMTYQNENWKLVRINRENANNWVANIDDKSILIENDINYVVNELVNQ